MNFSCVGFLRWPRESNILQLKKTHSVTHQVFPVFTEAPASFSSVVRWMKIFSGFAACLSFSEVAACKQTKCYSPNHTVMCWMHFFTSLCGTTADCQLSPFVHMHEQNVVIISVSHLQRYKIAAVTFVGLVPNKQVSLHLDDTIRCLCGNGTTSMVLLPFIKEINKKINKKQLLWFRHCTWPHCDCDYIVINCAALHGSNNTGAIKELWTPWCLYIKVQRPEQRGYKYSRKTLLILHLYYIYIIILYNDNAKTHFFE